jgi:hypothetical protein
LPCAETSRTVKFRGFCSRLGKIWPLTSGSRNIQRRQSVMRMRALAVIGEDLDHPALIDAAMAASLPPSFPAPPSAPSGCGCAARPRQAAPWQSHRRMHRTDADRPARLSSVRIASTSKPSSRAWRMNTRRLMIGLLVGRWFPSLRLGSRQQADALVIADRRHLDATLRASLANGDLFHDFSSCTSSR